MSQRVYRVLHNIVTDYNYQIRILGKLVIRYSVICPVAMQVRPGRHLLQQKRGRLNACECCTTEGPSTQYLRFLVPKTIPVMVFKYWVLGPFGYLAPKVDIIGTLGQQQLDTYTADRIRESGRWVLDKFFSAA